MFMSCIQFVLPDFRIKATSKLSFRSILDISVNDFPGYFIIQMYAGIDLVTR